MAFERKSMESMVQKMITWTQGVTTKLTDFRVGSKIRAIYEAVALILEEEYDRVYRAIKQLIEDNIYAIIGFDKVPSTYATGNAIFSRSTPADRNYIISAGTGLYSQATAYNPPFKFYTTEDAILAIGTTSIAVPVVCERPGTQGNIAVGTLTTFIQKPIGIEAVTNSAAFNTGREEETKEAQKARFQEFVQAQARGVLQSIEFGAKKAVVTDDNGIVIEKVYQSKALEDLPSRKGEVDLYVFNGVGEASEELISAIDALMTGYFDNSGNPIYGYKAAGILVNIYSTSIKYVKIKIELTPDNSTTIEALKPTVESEIDRYFLALNMGGTLIQSALQSNIKLIEGVQDIKLYLSLDNGTTWTTNNVTTTDIQIAVAIKPIVY